MRVRVKLEARTARTAWLDGEYFIKKIKDDEKEEDISLVEYEETASS